jgi:hypothetical protein
MPYLIGTDEAGYSPNLGPLVISVTLWHVDDVASDDSQCDLYARLRKAVCRTPSKASGVKRVAIADSKALYSPASGLSQLERGVLAMLAQLGDMPSKWQDVWRMLDADSPDDLPLLPWHADYQLRLPLAADADDLIAACKLMRRGLESAGVRLLAVRSTAVFPERFNQCTSDCGNKAEALSRLTLSLLADVLALCPGDRVTIVCDKHGGRNSYGRLLQQQFPDPLIEVYRESLAESVYRWGSPDERVEIAFRAGGESFLPAALSSMVSKYLRELAMRAFNDFWCGQLPELAPTAGYPLDARRFKAAIAPLQERLGIEDRILWRTR